MGRGSPEEKAEYNFLDRFNPYRIIDYDQRKN